MLILKRTKLGGNAKATKNKHRVTVVRFPIELFLGKLVLVVYIYWIQLFLFFKVRRGLIHI